MNLINIFTTYFHYLIHPFKTHEMLVHPERFPDESIMRLGVYESLTTSWVFVMLNGILRIILLNFVLLLLVDVMQNTDFAILEMMNIQDTPGLYFIVLSAILDIIFYPLFGIFMIQFWEFIIRTYAKLMGVQGDITQKAQDILAVNMSSKVLMLIPFFGSALESMASMVLMYAGLRRQLNASVGLSLCIIFTPVLFMLVLATMVLTFSLVIL